MALASFAEGDSEAGDSQSRAAASVLLLPPSSVEDNTPAMSSPPPLRRSLTLLDLVLLGIGASIGSGIFVITGVAARIAGPAVTLSFALAAGAASADALCFAELAARFPGKVGGAYLYARSAFGPLLGFVLFCHLLFDYHIGAAAIARSLASYLSSLTQNAFSISLPAVLSPSGLHVVLPLSFLTPVWPFASPPALDLSLNLLAPLLLAAISALLCRGAREASSLNDVMTGAKLAIVVAVVAVGACYVDPTNWQPFFRPTSPSLSLHPHPHPLLASAAANATLAASHTRMGLSSPHPSPSVPSPLPWQHWHSPHALPPPLPPSPGGLAAVLAATSVVFFSYVGFDAVANSAEEAVHPHQDVPRAVLLSLSVCAALYVAVAAVVTGMLPLPQLDASAPLAAAFAAHGLRFMAGVIDAGAVAGLTTTVLTGLYVQARMYVALSRDGLLPAFFSSVSAPPASVPLNAQLFVGLLAAILASLFDVQRLSHLLSVGVLLSYSLVCIAVPVLRLVTPASPCCDSRPLACPPLALPDRVKLSAGLAGLLGGALGLGAAALRLTSATPQHLGSSSSSSGGSASAAAVAQSAIVAEGSFLSSLPSPASLLASAASSPPLALAAALACLLLCGASACFLSLHFRFDSPHVGFKCPWVPLLPFLGASVNLFLLAQTDEYAWLRLAAVTVLGLAVYWGAHSRGREGGAKRRTPGEQEAVQGQIEDGEGRSLLGRG